ncbi:MAG: primosomal replication protein N, partial [Dehalococcoidia bacterium]|nr:primosomal replication protein N [Dehalococcoidia bacterium]
MGRPAFQGFPPRMSYTPLPSLFFSLLLPAIKDLAELKVTLHLFWTFSTRRTYPRYVTEAEMLRDNTLLESLSAPGEKPEAALRRGLALARERGTFLHLALEARSGVQELYFMNTERDRRAVDEIRRGQLDLGQSGVAAEEDPPDPRPNIFALYEDNIGM